MFAISLFCLSIKQGGHQYNRPNVVWENKIWENKNGKLAYEGDNRCASVANSVGGRNDSLILTYYSKSGRDLSKTIGELSNSLKDEFDSPASAMFHSVKGSAKEARDNLFPNQMGTYSRWDSIYHISQGHNGKHEVATHWHISVSGASCPEMLKQIKLLAGRSESKIKFNSLEARYKKIIKMESTQKGIEKKLRKLLRDLNEFKNNLQTRGAGMENSVQEMIDEINKKLRSGSCSG